LITDCWNKADYWVVGKFIIMPDHIHLFCANANYKYPDLKPWVSYWKYLVSKSWPYKEECPIWQPDFWDRQLRSGEHYGRKWEYIRNNPVDKGLSARSEDWAYQGELNILHW
jgi:putative transposase